MQVLRLTFDSILAGVLPMVPDELIGSESRARIQAIESRLPAILASSMFGFECPLATDHPEADFLVSVSVRTERHYCPRRPLRYAEWFSPGMVLRRRTG